MFGSTVRELRLRKGLTQTELARTLGVSQQTIAGWERDVNYPNIPVLQRLAQYFDVSIDFLLDNEPHSRASFSADELSLVADYRALDDRGKQFIRDSLEMSRLRLNASL